MKTKLKISILFAVMVFSFCMLSYAQASRAIIEGNVLDDSGNALPGVAITVKNVETGLLRSTTTENDGYYRIVSLPPGIYTITARLSGFKTENRENITLYVGQTAVINFELEMATLEESITVTGQAPLVQTTKSEIGQVVETKRIEDLPMADRDFLDLAKLAPGVAPSMGFAAGERTISSFSFRNIAININGLDVSDVTTRGQYGFVTAEVVREFQVLTSRYSAEYGRSLSGVVNIITKSGTNEWHGSVYSYFRDEAFDNPYWIFNYDNMEFEKEKEKTNYTQVEYGFNLSGPIIKNKTHFYLHYERAKYESPQYVTADPSWSLPSIDISGEVGKYPYTYKPQQMMLKIDHQLNPKHYLVAQYLLRTYISENLYVGGLQTQKFGCKNEYEEHLFLISETFSLSDKAVNEFGFQFGQRRADWIPNDRHPAIYQYTTYGVICSSGSHPSTDQLNTTRRIQVKDDFSLTLPRTKTGDHNFKLGFDIQYLYGNHDTRYSKNGYYVVWYGSPYYYVQAFGRSAYEFNIWVYGVYLQDDWRINKNLTLNLGVRYDYNTYTPKDKNNISPRLGFALDPLGDGKTVIRGGVGLYYDLAFTQLNQSASCFGREGMYNITFYPYDPLYPSGWNKIEALPEGKPIPARNVREIDPNFKTSHSLQTSVGFARQLSNDFALSLDAVYIRGYNLIRQRDINAPTEFHGPYPRGYEASYADLYRPTRPTYGGFRQINWFESTGKSEYKALMVNLTKRLSHNYSFQISYTLSDAKDDLGYGGDYVSAPNDSMHMDAEWGYSLNFNRHSIAFNGLWYLPYGFSVGGIYMAYSGRPYTAQLGYDYNGDGNANDRPPGVGKNTLMGNWFHQVDLFVSKEFKLKSFGLILKADVFNALNIRNLSGFGNIVGTQIYQVATEAYSPRNIRLSARIHF